MGKYIYCIIGSPRPSPRSGTERSIDFGPIGIGDRGDEVYTICYEDIGAVISSSPITKYPVSRDNTMAHQIILEKAMEDCTVLPARFCTIAKNEEEIVEKVLKGRYKEFKELLAKMEGKVELGVKAFWKDMDLIFREIAEIGEIRRLKAMVVKNPAQSTRDLRIKVGELVQSALESKKKSESEKIVSELKEIAVDYRINDTYGDKWILNSAFLTDKAKEKEFDTRMNELDKRYGERIDFKYVGPVPPCNFVEIRVTW